MLDIQTTNFPNGLSAMGIPTFGAGGLLPFTGRYFFCDYLNGSDGNPGSANAPMQTITAAHDLAVAGRNDVIFIVGNGGTTGTQRLSASFTWSKDATHLIGLTAPAWEAQRARIAPLTTATVNLSPLMTVSASGCLFSNFSFFQGIGQTSTDEQLINITGSRNYFGNVAFGGIGAAAGAARAGSYCILITGGGENTFERCSVGLETIQRGAANANVRLRSGAQRNQFLNCLFEMAASATSPLFVDANATNALNGASLTFRNCTFRNLTGIPGSNTPAVTATIAADANGTIFFDQCTTMAAKWAAATTLVKVASTPVSNGFNGGVYASAADS